MESGAKGRPESAGGSPLEARVRIFERLASEVAKLNFYTARGKARYHPGVVGKFLPLYPEILDRLSCVKPNHHMQAM
jgi:hypothetical protein